MAVTSWTRTLQDSWTLQRVTTNVFWVTGTSTATGTNRADYMGQNPAELSQRVALKNIFYGLGGNDLIEAGFGSDYLYGGSGEDRLRGGPGADLIDGGSGLDTAQYASSFRNFQFSGTKNSLWVSQWRAEPGVPSTLREGRDFLKNVEYLTFNDFYGSFSKVTYTAADCLRIGKVGNSIDAGNTDYYSWFREKFGYVVKEGTASSDLVVGNDGRNHLIGGDGNDRLIGGKGADLLAGGAGSDVFLFRSTAESRVGTNADIILDFSHDEGDKIDLHQVDADKNTYGDQNFTFIGKDKFNGVAGELRINRMNGATHVLVDTDGNKRADMEIIIQGVDHVSAHDFLF